MKQKWLLIIAILISSGSYAQTGYISGKVIDSTSFEPLAFVTVFYNETGQGVVTNLDGIFRIPVSAKIRSLRLKYLGYKDKVILHPEDFGPNQVIRLSPDPTFIREVVVYPGINPAHRIIKLATENRNKNNPEKSGPFSYVSYDKVIFGLESDTTLVKNADSTDHADLYDDTLKYGMDGKGRIDVRRFLEKQYLFMMESVVNRKFLSPDKNKEEVIASKVSGISQPTFMVMARQFQSFSFYDNLITIADRQFLNPIAPGSTEKYFFLIQDTLFTDRADTVFVISFRPAKGKNFEGLKGVLYINSHGYAVQNVIAEASEQGDRPFMVSIQQQYELVNGLRWFPVLLSSTVRINPARFGYNAPVNLVGTGKSYIVNIDFNPQLDASQFSDIQLQVNDDAHKQPESVWEKYRTDSLSSRERETYRVIDSLGKAEHLDRTMLSLETLLTGYLPGKYWNFDIRRFIDYNPFEGLRLGAGGRTTPRLIKWLTAGGYLAYGLKDKALKYSGYLTFNLWPEHEVDMTLLYRNDVRESGGIRFNETWTLSGSSFIRDYMVSVMDETREKEISAGFRAIKYLKVQGYLTNSDLTPSNDYAFSISDENPDIMLTRFYLTETGIRLKYAYKETFMKSPRGNKFSMGTNYPILYFNIGHGMRVLGGEFDYWRTEVKVTKVFKSRLAGNTHAAVIAGMVSGNVPYSKLYAGRGSYRPFTLETEQSFGTMRFNEFLSDRFFGLFLKQDLGKLLFKPKGKFQPEIALVHNLGFGSLVNKEPHKNITFKTMEKGYFEGGLLINNLFRIQVFKYGLGVFYRYGPYMYPKTIDNFAFKLSLQFNL
ncbi:MAG TPA: DUF5686 family protein [Bacteroidales bacterium]|nr:DUF5686 family protein [Bacteroidales bacterium]